jgi:hypothetical protein
VVTILIAGADFSDYVVKCDRIPITVRNRDFSPIAEGFSFSLGWNISHIPSEGDEVVVKVDSVPVYIGIVKQIYKDWNEREYQIELDNYLSKLTKIMVSHFDLHYYIEDTIEVTEPYNLCTFDSATMLVSCERHELTNDQAIILFKSGGSVLPEGLFLERYYYVQVETVDTFFLKDNTGALLNIEFTTDGTGSFWFRRADADKWNYKDYELKPNVNLVWLISQIFRKIAVTVNFDNVEDLVLYNTIIGGASYDVTLKDCFLDYGMFYALNQDEALNWEAIEDVYSVNDNAYTTSRITCFEFIAFIFSVFELTYQITDESPRIIKLYRKDQVQTLTDDQKLSYSTTKLLKKAVEGYIYYRKYHTNRQFYNEPGAGVELTEYNKAIFGAGQEEITIFNNFRIFLRDKQIPAPGKLADTDTVEYDVERIFNPMVTVVNDDYLEESITIPLDKTITKVKEHYLNASDYTSEIVQESLIT